MPGASVWERSSSRVADNKLAEVRISHDHSHTFQHLSGCCMLTGTDVIEPTKDVVNSQVYHQIVRPLFVPEVRTENALLGNSCEEIGEGHPERTLTGSLNFANGIVPTLNFGQCFVRLFTSLHYQLTKG